MLRLSLIMLSNSSVEWFFGNINTELCNLLSTARMHRSVLIQESLLALLGLLAGL